MEAKSKCDDSVVVTTFENYEKEQCINYMVIHRMGPKDISILDHHIIAITPGYFTQTLIKLKRNLLYGPPSYN